MNWRIYSVIAGLAVIVIIVIFLLYPTPVEEPEGIAPDKPEPAETVATRQERGDAAREIIQKLQEKTPIDYDDAFRRGRRYHKDGRLADAQILYLFAARGGHAQAAFELAAMYDPIYHSPDTSLMDEPDPFQAYKWYKKAEESNHVEAGARLERLHAWVQEAANKGDAEAERLLLVWE